MYYGEQYWTKYGPLWNTLPKRVSQRWHPPHKLSDYGQTDNFQTSPEQVQKQVFVVSATGYYVEHCPRLLKYQEVCITTKPFLSSIAFNYFHNKQ